MTTISDRIRKRAAFFQKKYGWRYGQSIFNAANELAPEEANKLRGVYEFDPFHRSENVEKFLAEVERLDALPATHPAPATEGERK